MFSMALNPGWSKMKKLIWLKATSLAGSVLPEGYTRIKGMSMNNDCYYEIPGLYLEGSDTLRFSCSITSTCNLIGSYSGTSGGYNYSVYASTSNVNYLRYYPNTYNSQFDADTRYDITITPTGTHGMKKDSVWEESEFTTVRPFCIGTTAAAITTSAKMKGSFYDNIEVVGKAKFIPCVRDSDDVVGWYDTFSETFHEPAAGSTNPTIVT